jgi:hypothetical protein
MGAWPTSPAADILICAATRANVGFMTALPPNATPLPTSEVTAFHRTELNLILQVYGRMVALGEWRDYGILSARDLAVFAIYRRTAESPLYRVEKRPKLRLKQGQYAVIGSEGQVLRRGHDLAAVLRVFEARNLRVIE